MNVLQDKNSGSLSTADSLSERKNSRSNTDTMAKMTPFRAWRYDPVRTDVQKAIAPPYDIISPEGQKLLYQKSPYNCIRLILNEELPTDTPENNRYTRARDFFTEWKSKGILTREAQPSFYLYRQQFADPRDKSPKSRLALLGRLKLESLDSGIVVPHEKTLSKPKQDRRKLLEATQTNFSPIFGLYEGEHVEQHFKEEAARAPLFDVTDDEGVRHTLWALQDPEKNQWIEQQFRSKKIYIADGHHRYQTAFDYAQDRRREKKAAENEELPSDYVLTALVEFHDPGLVLLPTHRILQNVKGFDPKKALESLRPFFDLSPMPAETLLKAVKTTGSEQPFFGLFFKDQQFLLTLKRNADIKSKMPAGKPDVWYSLDVNLLGHLIFASLWNVPETEWENSLRFTQSEEVMQKAVCQKETNCAFFLRAPEVEILRDMGEVRELMPQKSTYFYPKLASGLVFYSHNEKLS